MTDTPNIWHTKYRRGTLEDVSTALNSSVASVLSGAAANCWEDILRLKFSHLHEAVKALINRLLGAYHRMCYKLTLFSMK